MDIVGVPRMIQVSFLSRESGAVLAATTGEIPRDKVDVVGRDMKGRRISS